MPFHTRLLGKDRLALYSFIHSLNTNFGTSVFEPVAVALARSNFADSKAQVKAGEYISEEAFRVIQEIMTDLTAASGAPDKPAEIERIKAVCQSGKMIKVKPTKVDVFARAKDGEIFLFDIKTAKPNAGGFKEFKRTLLEWITAVLADTPDAKVNSLIAIPFDALRRGMINSRKTDAIVKIKYRNNPSMLAAWAVASHLERAPKSSKPEPATIG